MPRALVTAEAFGYGPPSKLNAVCRQLARNSYECHLVGESTAYAFAAANSDTYASIREIERMTDLDELDSDAFDIAVSVMDPFLPVWAHFHDVPCAYVDSLFWFWNWSEPAPRELVSAVDDVQNAGDAAAALETMAALPMHVGQYVAHCLATVNCVQNTPGVEERIHEMRHPARFRRVGAIIDLSYLRPEAQNVWLATASGMLNPLLPYAAAVDWLRTVAKMVDEAARSAEIRETILLTGNPDVLASASDVETARIRIAPLDHASMLRTMNRAIACLAPPGLTTVLECAAYGIPVILLPEQHYGHLANFHRLTAVRDGAFPHGIVGDRLEQRSDRHLEDTLAVAERLRRHAAARDGAWDQMVTGIAAGLRDVQQRREQLVALQQGVVDQLVGRYAGAAEVAACVEEIRGHSRVLDSRRRVRRPTP